METKKLKIKNLKFDNGSILIYAVVIIFIFSLVVLGLLSYATMELRITRSTVAREQAFQIAEAGANYYQWHLNFFPDDFWDGNASTTPGPYVHDYVDSATGKTIGRFSLQISRPTLGSTIVNIVSTGYTLESPQTTRTVTVRFGIPSLATYSFLANGQVWIGSTESVSGQFFSNGGIHFDGSGNAPIMSAKQTYACTPLFNCSPTTTKPGIWGSANQATRNFWQYPVPNVDFFAITANLSTLKSDAQTGGIYLPPSNAQGYSLVFKNDGTIDIYTVTSLANDPRGQDTNLIWHNESIDYQNRILLDNVPMPDNGAIFVEDNVWVEGTVQGRATVAAGVLPYNINVAPNIMIPNNIIYAARDGSDALGLLSQKNILVTYLSPNNLEIDAALIAQNGAVERYYYQSNTKNSITVYGAIASNETWTWSWNSPVTSGYVNTNTTYDSNLLYSPPPDFPLSSAGYRQISWSSN